MTINNRQDYVIIDLIQQAVRNVRGLPINLGGVSGAGGGEGGPAGGFIGLLAQTKVAYDTSEAAYLGLVSTTSGTLVDNLAHIRYRLNALEAGSGGGGIGSGITVIDDNTPHTYNDVDTIHFSGAGVLITDLGSGDIRVTISATGSGGGIPEAPIDGNTYGRKNGAWTTVSGVVTSGGSSYLSTLLDVNISGILDGDILVYSGGDSKWHNIQPQLDVPFDSQTYGRRNGTWVTISGTTSSGVPLVVEQYGGTPSITNVDKITFSGAIVSDLGSGDVLVTYSTTEDVSHKYNEICSGVPGRYFTTQYIYASGTLRLYYNGIRQVKGIHYIDDINFTTFSTYFDTYSGDYVIVDYDYLASSQISADALVDSDGILLVDSDGIQLI